MVCFVFFGGKAVFQMCFSRFGASMPRPSLVASQWIFLLARWIRLSTLCPKQKTNTGRLEQGQESKKNIKKMIAPKHILCLGAVSCQVGLYEMKVISDKTGGFMVRTLDENGQFVSAASDSFCMTVYDLGSAFG